MENPLAAYSTHLADLTARVGASTVAVLVDGAFASSGVSWREDGIVVTTAHALKKKEGSLSVLLPDGRQIPATLKGKVRGFDVAVLHIAEPVPPPAFGDPATARPGQLMLVAGRSLDTGVNATMGVVSAVSGPWHTWAGGHMQRFIRLDVALFTGVDGGAVIDPSGTVIGLATSALSRIAGVVIPRDTVDSAIEAVLAGNAGETAFLGVGLHEIDYEGRRIPIVLSVEPGGAAASGGIVVGDLIAAFNGKPTSGIRELWTTLNDGSVIGHPVEIQLIRGGEPVSITVTMGTRTKG